MSMKYFLENLNRHLKIEFDYNLDVYISTKKICSNKF